MKKRISLVLVSIIMLSAIFASSVSAFAAQYKEVQGKYNYSYAVQVLDLVNQERKNYGLSALTMTEALTDGAMIRAAETTVSFSHTRPNGEQCFTAFSWSRAAGENIAYGQRSPQQVVTAWMNSSGHRKNILSSDYTTIGIGCFEYGGTYYWSQAFSGGSGSAYYPSGSKSVSVNVSLTPGAQSYLIGEQNTVVSSSQSTTKAATTTKKTETTTKAPSTTKKAETITKRVTTTKRAETTTKKAETTTRKAEPSTSKQNNQKYSIYSRMRQVMYRIIYYFR